MSHLGAYQLHENLFENAVANGVSRAVFAQDFKTIQFTISTNALANLDIEVIKSNQELPPDPTVAASPTNQYSVVGYTDESDQVFYAGGTPYNPSGVSVNKTFNVETTGARWIFYKVSGYVAGTLEKLDCELFSNFN